MMRLKKMEAGIMKSRDSRLSRLKHILTPSSVLHSAAALRLFIIFIWWAVLFSLTVFALAPVRYDITIGMVPSYTIAANKDIVDEIATEQKRAAAATAITPTFYFQEGVTENVLSKLDQTFAQLIAVCQYSMTLPDRIADRKYSFDELSYARTMLTTLDLRDYQITTLLNTTADSLEILYSSLYAAVKNTMAGYIAEGLENEAISSIMQIVGFRTETSLLQNVVQPVLKSCIQANMVIDNAATSAAREIARTNVDPIVYKKGQNIVVKGEGRITNSQIQMLNGLGLINDNHVDFKMYFGAALFVLLAVVITISLLKKFEHLVIDDTKRLTLFCAVVVFVLGICLFASMESYYLLPVMTGAMLLTATLGLKTGIIGNITLAVLLCSLAGGSTETSVNEVVNVTLIALLSGTVCALIIHNKPSRTRILLSGFIVIIVNVLTYLSLEMIMGSNISNSYTGIVHTVFSGIISTLLCIAFQPLLELLFNLPTPTKLMELSNPEQPLLRRLMLEAPGTYHHSIIVANLAEAAAEAAGANPLLARVAGYYHDIGKLKRPLYFKENQIGDINVHNSTEPKVSAAIVTAHTRDGVELAKTYHLPQEIISIISEHHGDTPVIYFYHKAQQLSNGSSVDISDFRYNGSPPTSKESAIIMLCDTIEAAVRSMQNPTPERIEDFIVRLIRGKLEDGQLANCPLTLRDIDAICAACITVLVGVFHERIEYPDISNLSVRRGISEIPMSGAAKEETEDYGSIENILSQQHEINARPPYTPSPLPVPMPEIKPEQVINTIPVPIVEPSQFDEVKPMPVVDPVQFNDTKSILAVAPPSAEQPAKVNENKPVSQTHDGIEEKRDNEKPSS